MQHIMNKTIISTLVLMLFMPVIVCHADDSQTNDDVRGFRGWFAHSENQAERLRELRTSDPERFNQIIQKKRERVKERLAQLKEQDPEKFETLKSELAEKRIERFRHIKEENPERFKEMVHTRRQRFDERLMRMKEHNPKRYEQLMTRRDQFRKLSRVHAEHPEQFERVLEQHPRLRKKIEQRKERRERLSDVTADSPLANEIPERNELQKNDGARQRFLHDEGNRPFQMKQRGRGMRDNINRGGGRR